MLSSGSLVMRALPTWISPTFDKLGELLGSLSCRNGTPLGTAMMSHTNRLLIQSISLALSYGKR